MTPECGPVTLNDPVDTLSFDAGDWLQSGDFTCTGLRERAASFYRSGLDAHNGAQHQYSAYGGWTCTAQNSPSADQQHSAYDLFTCIGEPFPRSTLPEEISFDAQPPAVALSCTGVFCAETYPVENGDYGDTNDYAAAGLVMQSESGGQAPAPVAGSYNRLALCTWKDEGSPDNGQTESWYCGDPG